MGVRRKQEERREEKLWSVCKINERIVFNKEVDRKLQGSWGDQGEFEGEGLGIMTKTHCIHVWLFKRILNK